MLHESRGFFEERQDFWARIARPVSVAPHVLLLAYLGAATAGADDRDDVQRPRIVLERVRADPETCWHLRAEGFPALDDAAGIVVVPSSDILQLSPIPGEMRLEWHEVATGELRDAQVLVPPLATTDRASCARALAELQRHVAAANARLAAGTWRSLPRLPVAYLPRASTRSYRLEVPAAQRRVQLVVQGGALITRIPGVRVLARHPLAPRMGDQLFVVFGDRRAGVVVVVTLECTGDDCTCDPGFRPQVLRWESALFDAVARLPCDPADSEYMTCSPQDLDFGPDFSPWSL